MKQLREKITTAKEWWHGLTEWEQAKVLSSAAVTIPSIAVMYLIQINLWNEIGEYYIAPVGWALFAFAPWVVITSYLARSELIASVVAKVTRRDVGVRYLEASAHDYALLLKHVAYRGPYVIAALAAPIALGVLNIYILWVESGATLSYEQMQTLIPMIGTFVVVVACVQLAIIMHLFSPATFDSDRLNDFVARLRGEANG